MRRLLCVLGVLGALVVSACGGSPLAPSSSPASVTATPQASKAPEFLGPPATASCIPSASPKALPPWCRTSKSN